MIGTGVYAVPGVGVAKLPQPGIVFEGFPLTVVPGGMPLGGPNAGLVFDWPERFGGPVVMLYGVPAEKIMIGLSDIACGRFSVPNRNSR